MVSILEKRRKYQRDMQKFEKDLKNLKKMKKVLAFPDEGCYNDEAETESIQFSVQ